MLRKPDSIPASDVLIEDALIEPYFITKSPATGYTVYERIETGKDKKQYIKTIGYFTNFAGCLRVIAKELINHKDKNHYTTIKEYIQAYNDIEAKITTLTEV